MVGDPVRRRDVEGVRVMVDDRYGKRIFLKHRLAVGVLVGLAVVLFSGLFYALCLLTPRISYGPWPEVHTIPSVPSAVPVSSAVRIPEGGFVEPPPEPPFGPTVTSEEADAALGLAVVLFLAFMGIGFALWWAGGYSKETIVSLKPLCEIPDNEDRGS